MGRKVHPIGFRTGVIRDWQSRWYAEKTYGDTLHEDLELRKEIRQSYPEAGISMIEIDRQSAEITVTVHTARPGIVIGRGGERVDKIRGKLEALVGKKVRLNIREIRQTELDAFLVAKSIAEQMEKRVAYRRAMKQAMFRTMQAGAKGIRILCSGRLAGAEIARKQLSHQGRVPLHTLRADVDYGFIEAHTAMGLIGVKVWIYRGDILPEKKTAEAEQITGEETVAEQGGAPEETTAIVGETPVVSKEEDDATTQEG